MNASFAGFLIAFVSGYVDTATFMGLHGLFSAHITGNFVLFAVAAVEGAKDIDYLKIIAFVPFVFAVAFTAWLSRMKAFNVRFSFWILSLASAIFFLSGLFFIFETNSSAFHLLTPRNLVAMTLVFAMGTLNALQKIVTPKEPATTVMTGNATQMVLEIAGFLDNKENALKIKSLSRVIFGFVLGCLSAALLMNHFDLKSLLLPSFILAVLAAVQLKTVD